MYRTKIYSIWQQMLGRCRRPTNPGYKYYGGRGVSVCERWQTFENFATDMGEPPFTGASIDRIDVNGNYEPANVRWASQKTQMNNRSDNFYVEFRGERMTLTALAEKCGINAATLRGRIVRGASVEDAVSARKHERLPNARNMTRERSRADIVKKEEVAE